MAPAVVSALWSTESLEALARNRRARPAGVLVFVLGALALGFSFFWSNFLIDWTPLALLMPLSGVVILGAFYLAYRLLLSGLLLLPGLRAAEGSESAGAVQGRSLLARGEERSRWLRTLGWGFLLPISSLHLCLAAVNALLLALGFRPAVVFLSDYAPFLGYLWALCLSLQATTELEPRRRYAANLRILTAFFGSYALLTLVFFRLKLLAVGFFR